MSYHNLVELFRRQGERLGPVPALRYKRYGLYHDLSWEQYGAEVRACAAALLDVGINQLLAGTFARRRIFSILRLKIRALSEEFEGALRIFLL